MLHLHTARSIALSETAQDFVQRVRGAYPGIPSHKALLKSQGHPAAATDAPAAVPLATAADNGNRKWGAVQSAGDAATASQDERQPRSELASPALRLPMLISACPGAALSS